MGKKINWYRANKLVWKPKQYMFYVLVEVLGHILSFYTKFTVR